MMSWFPVRGRAWFNDFIALLGGALLPLSLSPYDLWPFALVSPALLYAVVSTGSTGRAIWRFYLYNVGLFGVGISWIYVSIHQYGGASVLLAGSMVALFVLAYSLVCLPLAWLFARWCRSATLLEVAGFAGIWVLQEWFRGWFLTGFPWLFLGYGAMGTPLQNYAPVLGIFGMSLATILIATLLTAALMQRRWLYLVPVFAIGLIGVGLGQASFTASNAAIRVSLVQGNVDQLQKWRQDNRMPIIARYRQATESEWGRDLIIWPEAAITLFREQAGPVLTQLDERARASGSTLVLGIPDRDPAGSFLNTVLALGEGEGQYIKRRLVPFGEYVPLENLLRGLIRLFDLPMSRNVAGPDKQSALLAGELRLSTSICYEVVYPDLVRTTVWNPDLLLTVSNDTWFGTSIGPWQHLQMARMRAIENGRSLVRATNNGVTALIDHKGNLLAELPQFEAGVLRGEVELRTGITPYHRYGNLPVLACCLLLLAFGWLGGPRWKQLGRPGSGETS